MDVQADQLLNNCFAGVQEHNFKADTAQGTKPPLLTTMQLSYAATAYFHHLSHSTTTMSLLLQRALLKLLTFGM